MLSLAHWEFVNVYNKTEIFNSHVLLREVKIGKSMAMAAIVQNSRVSAKLYPDFSKVQPDDVARYLLKSFSPKFDKEMLESVSLYRTETDLDHVRLMVKKRKHDFLISFAFVKKAFIYRSYNETDFFQRLFIAVENKKAGEAKTSKLFHLPTLLMPQTAWAADFSMGIDTLLGSIGSVSNQASVSSLSNLAFASQNLDPATIKNATDSLSRGANALEAIPSSADRLSGSIFASSKTIEGGLHTASTSVDRLTDTVKDPKLWIAGGALFQLGTMFSNAVALGVNYAFKAMRDILYDFLSIYKPGEKEKLLEQADRAWREYEGLAAQMYQREKDLQELEIALQLASGTSVEQIYNLDEKSLSKDKKSLKLSGTQNSCSAESLPSIGEIEKLRQLAESIKTQPGVIEALCKRVDRNMDLIEGLSSELALVRTKLSNSMMVTYNNIYSDKLSSLKAPEVIDKAIKECASNAKEEIKADEFRYKKWNCDNNPTDDRCKELKKFIEETKGDIAQCDEKGKIVLARDDDQYIKTRKSLRESKARMDDAMSSFLRADCIEENKQPYCQGTDGVVVKVKKAYNTSLLSIKAKACPNLKSDRFDLNPKVAAGELPATQTEITPTITSSTNIVSTDVTSDGATRAPATETADSGDPNKPNLLMRGWNSFISTMKSLFSWFK